MSKKTALGLYSRIVRFCDKGVNYDSNEINEIKNACIFVFTKCNLIYQRNEFNP